VYRIYKLAKDTKAISEGDGKKTRGLLLFFLFGLITLGIYCWVWYFMLGDRLQDNAARYGLSFKEGGGTILLWMLLGSFIIVGPFISVYIITKNINALAIAYNAGVRPKA
jgi:heme/copper-type cytochrome/quinol oxidase subunit 2